MDWLARLMLPTTSVDVVEEQPPLRLSYDLSHLLVMNLNLLRTAVNGTGEWIATSVKLQLDEAELFYCLVTEVIRLLPFSKAVIDALSPLRFSRSDYKKAAREKRGGDPEANSQMIPPSHGESRRPVGLPEGRLLRPSLLGLSPVHGCERNRRRALAMTRRVAPVSARIAIHRLVWPVKARMRNSTFIATAKATLN